MPSQIANEPKVTQPESNKVFVLEEQGKFGYSSRPKPTVDSRYVLVKVLVTGLCGSDIHYWKHGRIGNYVVEKPIVLGHESAGIVVEVGPDVKDLRVGDRVALEPGVSCNNCRTCRSGRYNLCSGMRFAATPPYDGTLATYYPLPEECCVKLPAHVSLREGALVEPLSVAVHVMRLAGDVQGKEIVIFGAGPIGLLCSAVAKAFGAKSVVVVDIVESRLEFAREFSGAKSFQMTSQAPEANAESLCNTFGFAEGADVVVDATGAEPCIETGVHTLKRGGIFIQAGLGSPRVNFPIGQICDKEATLKGSFRYGPGDYQLAVGLLDSGRVSLKSLVTHEFSFEEAEKAFINVAERKGIKTLILGPNVDAGFED
ncbi:GroES-like protein [Aureobasidium pullulans]|nr:GroES-like protein [Aureobasidium pullulans]